MAEDFKINLSNAQRFQLLDVFQKQKVQIQDYNAALIWKETFDRLEGSWKWSKVSAAGFDALPNKDEERPVTLSTSNGHVLVLQLLVAMREGIYDGGEVRTMVEVIEMVRKNVPNIIQLSSIEEHGSNETIASVDQETQQELSA